MSWSSWDSRGGGSWDSRGWRGAWGPQGWWSGGGPSGRAATSSGQPWGHSDEDWNTSAAAAHQAVPRAGGPLALLKDRDLASEDTRWEPLVEDGRRRSFSYVLRRHRTGLSEEELSRWFQALHPNNAGVGTGSWTDAAYQGRRLLRKTAWYVAPPCTCAYDYADTHQDVVTSPAFRGTIEEITVRVAEVCGLADPPNSVNLNFYPPGGGVGFHSDDEPIFDGLQRDTCIISLSLTEPGEVGCGVGSRWFEVKLKRAFCLGAADRRTRAVELRHGDIMTMEGFFQMYYLHSAWPGDRDDVLQAPGRSAFGERINLTWRWVVRHGEGCPLAAEGAADDRA